MSLRIIAGEKRGMALITPRGGDTRPTLGRVRESLFGILTPWLPEARVLDCFAGCGALGLEALSRGAFEAVFVEHSRPALVALETNIQKLQLTDRAKVITRDALQVLRQPHPPDGKPFDLLLLDPPYGVDHCHRSLELLAQNLSNWLLPGGIVAAQHGKRDSLNETYGPLESFRLADYSETRVAFYHLAE